MAAASGRLPIFIDTSIGTRLAVAVPPHSTAGDLKRAAAVEHAAAFPAHGKVTVTSVKVQHEGNLYHLSDSTPLLDFAEGAVHLHVEVLSASSLLSHHSGKPLAGSEFKLPELPGLYENDTEGVISDGVLKIKKGARTNHSLEVGFVTKDNNIVGTLNDTGHEVVANESLLELPNKTEDLARVKGVKSKKHVADFPDLQNEDVVIVNKNERTVANEHNVFLHADGKDYSNDSNYNSQDTSMIGAIQDNCVRERRSKKRNDGSHKAPFMDTSEIYQSAQDCQDRKIDEKEVTLTEEKNAGCSDADSFVPKKKRHKRVKDDAVDDLGNEDPVQVKKKCKKTEVSSEMPPTLASDKRGVIVEETTNEERVIYEQTQGVGNSQQFEEGCNASLCQGDNDRDPDANASALNIICDRAMEAKDVEHAALTNSGKSVKEKKKKKNKVKGGYSDAITATSLPRHEHLIVEQTINPENISSHEGRLPTQHEPGGEAYIDDMVAEETNKCVIVEENANVESVAYEQNKDVGSVEHVEEECDGSLHLGAGAGEHDAATGNADIGNSVKGKKKKKVAKGGDSDAAIAIAREEHKDNLRTPKEADGEAERPDDIESFTVADRRKQVLKNADALQQNDFFNPESSDIVSERRKHQKAKFRSSHTLANPDAENSTPKEEMLASERKYYDGTEGSSQTAVDVYKAQVEADSVLVDDSNGNTRKTKRRKHKAESGNTDGAIQDKVVPESRILSSTDLKSELPPGEDHSNSKEVATEARTCSHDRKRSRKGIKSSSDMSGSAQIMDQVDEPYTSKTSTKSSGIGDDVGSKIPVDSGDDISKHQSKPISEPAVVVPDRSAIIRLLNPGADNNNHVGGSIPRRDDNVDNKELRSTPKEILLSQDSGRSDGKARRRRKTTQVIESEKEQPVDLGTFVEPIASSQVNSVETLTASVSLQKTVKRPDSEAGNVSSEGIQNPPGEKALANRATLSESLQRSTGVADSHKIPPVHPDASEKINFLQAFSDGKMDKPSVSPDDQLKLAPEPMKPRKEKKARRGRVLEAQVSDVGTPEILGKQSTSRDEHQDLVVQKQASVDSSAETKDTGVSRNKGLLQNSRKRGKAGRGCGSSSSDIVSQDASDVETRMQETGHQAVQDLIMKLPASAPSGMSDGRGASCHDSGNVENTAEKHSVDLHEATINSTVPSDSRNDKAKSYGWDDSSASSDSEVSSGAADDDDNEVDIPLSGKLDLDSLLRGSSSYKKVKQRVAESQADSAATADGEPDIIFEKQDP